MISLRLQLKSAYVWSRITFNLYNLINFNFNCSVSEAIHSRKIKFLTKLQLSDNILFKTFAKSISEELVSLSSIDAAMFRDVIMDIGCYLYFFLVKLIKHLYFILVVWLILYYHYWRNKDDHNPIVSLRC